MAGYSRFWTCETCGERQESIDYPRDPICDRCHERRLAERHMEAIRGVVGGVLQGFDAKPNTVTLRYGRGRTLTVSGRDLVVEMSRERAS